ncbi:MAG: exodeoxyribonuclease VII small subunit [Acidobacteria bacterium]|nr:MAG: exodeoxyribonuclease VII small subunit [Acidobacteriota bacterium]
MSDTPDFETALKRLEEIVTRLENGELTLDSALQLFEEGIQPHAVPFESENEQ